MKRYAEMFLKASIGTQAAVTSACDAMEVATAKTYRISDVGAAPKPMAYINNGEICVLTYDELEAQSDKIACQEAIRKGPVRDFSDFLAEFESE